MGTIIVESATYGPSCNAFRGNDTSNLAGNIGQDILSHFSEVFDCMRSKVYFETTKQSTQPEVFNRAGFIFDSFGHGLQVMTVLPDSPGEQAGIAVGERYSGSRLNAVARAIAGLAESWISAVSVVPAFGRPRRPASCARFTRRTSSGSG